MKYLFQVGIIAAICFVSELLYVFLPLPIPASVYGIIILFLLLQFRIIKLRQVEDIADFFLKILPILFLAPSVGIMVTMDSIQNSLLSIVLIIVLSTIITTIVTRLVSQTILKFRNGKKKHE